MGLEKVMQSAGRSKKGIKGKILRLLLGIALLANISGCGRKVEIKERAMPMEVLRGVIADADIVKENYDNILIPNDGKPEFYISLDEMVATPTVKIYVDNDFKDRVGNFDIIFLGRADGTGFARKRFNFNKYKRGVYSDSLDISGRVFDFILSNEYYDDIGVRELLYEGEAVKEYYRRNGKTVIWNFY